ncbi:MAG: hypothetical protein HRT69_13655 [Flavobacteriaceae bacterium]|nr:hypothetical protein [Flavobacteriaceae bacterium]
MQQQNRLIFIADDHDNDSYINDSLQQAGITINNVDCFLLEMNPYPQAGNEQVDSNNKDMVLAELCHGKSKGADVKILKEVVDTKNAYLFDLLHDDTDASDGEDRHKAMRETIKDYLKKGLGSTVVVIVGEAHLSIRQVPKWTPLQKTKYETYNVAAFNTTGDIMTPPKVTY